MTPEQFKKEIMRAKGKSIRLQVGAPVLDNNSLIQVVNAIETVIV